MKVIEHEPLFGNKRSDMHWFVFMKEGRYCTQYNGCFFNGYGDPEKDFEFDTEDFGKDVFLTKEAAEKALKEMEDRMNGEIDKEIYRRRGVL